MLYKPVTPTYFRPHRFIFREYHTSKLLARRTAGNPSLLFTDWTELYTVKSKWLVVVIVDDYAVVVNISSITSIYYNLILTVLSVLFYIQWIPTSSA
jgi:hypothetical protein